MNGGVFESRTVQRLLDAQNVSRAQTTVVPTILFPRRPRTFFFYNFPDCFIFFFLLHESISQSDVHPNARTRNNAIATVLDKVISSIRPTPVKRVSFSVKRHGRVTFDTKYFILIFFYQLVAHILFDRRVYNTIAIYTANEVSFCENTKMKLRKRERYRERGIVIIYTYILVQIVL